MKPKREGMTDRDILLRYNVGDRKPLLGYKLTLDQALTQLRAYYREKIKKVGIKGIVDFYCQTDNYIQPVTHKRLLREIPNAILKEIDKEIG